MTTTSGPTTKRSLSPARRRLVELMQEVNFGRIKSLRILDGDPTFDPAVESEWLPGFTLRQDVQPHESSGSFWHDQAAPGRYRCWVTLSDAERLVDWDGEIGVGSNTVELTVGP